MAKHRSKWAAQDRARTKPRLAIVMSAEAREMAEALATERVQSVSQLLEFLVRAEFKKTKRVT